MIELANFFSPSATYTIFTVGFAAGLLFKYGIIAKHKKRVLSLENEMLSNHSRILDLEKQVTDLKNEKIKLSGSGGSQKAELKIS